MSSKTEKTVLYLVIPCFNEEKVLPVTAPLFSEKISGLIKNGTVSEKSKIMFVNDGSTDNTEKIIDGLIKENPLFVRISLSKNSGHQNALIAGLTEAKNFADAVISLDCDGQDDVDAIDKMLTEYKNGCDIVYGVRSDRKSDTFFKRNTARVFYKILKWLGADVVYNHADYRLTSKRVLNAFADYKEVNVYLRGMFTLVGFKSTSVYYERKKRFAGKTHYPLKKEIKLAIDGITSFSIKPIRIITLLGTAVFFISFLLSIWALISYFSGNAVAGWSSSVLAVCVLGGVQLISLGVIGEYIGKIYLEVKHRPKYIIKDKNFGKDETDL